MGVAIKGFLAFLRMDKILDIEESYMASDLNERIDQLSDKIYQRTASLNEFKEFNSLLDELLKEYDELRDNEFDIN